MQIFSNFSLNKYIKNILNRNEFNKSSNKVADFIIEDDNQSFYLNFIISKSQTSEFDYNSYMDLKVLEKEIQSREEDLKREKEKK